MRVKSGRIHKRWLSPRNRFKAKGEKRKVLVMEMADGTPTVQEGFRVMGRKQETAPGPLKSFFDHWTKQALSSGLMKPVSKEALTGKPSKPVAPKKGTLAYREQRYRLRKKIRKMGYNPRKTTLLTSVYPVATGEITNLAEAIELNFDVKFEYGLGMNEVSIVSEHGA